MDFFIAQASQSVSEISALVVVILLFVFGIIASILPVLPGALFVWFGVLIYKLWLPEVLSWSFVIVLGLVALLSQVIDLVCSYYGARRFGATWKGAVGALVGTILGPLLLGAIPVVGLILGFVIGPILGAIAGELIGGRSLRDGSRAGLGGVLGGLVAFAIKFAITIGMIAWFFVEIWRLPPDSLGGF